MSKRYLVQVYNGGSASFDKIEDARRYSWSKVNASNSRAWILNYTMTKNIGMVYCDGYGNVYFQNSYGSAYVLNRDGSLGKKL